MSASLLAFFILKIVTIIMTAKARPRRLINVKVAATAALLSQKCVAEDVLFEDNPVEEGSAVD